MADYMDLWSVFLWATVILTTITAKVPNDYPRHEHSTHVSHAITFQIGQTIYLTNTNDHSYTITAPRYALKQTNNGNGDHLATVLLFNTTLITAGDVEAKIDEYLAVDDVFTLDFLSNTYITSNAAGTQLTPSAIDYLRSIGASTILTEHTATSILGRQKPLALVPSPYSDIPPGPYSAKYVDGSVTLSTVYRLYPDTQRTFLYGTVPGRYDAFQAVHWSTPDLGAIGIPVPSRLYAIHDSRPLAGIRAGIKDSFDIKGLKTSAGSRAWAEIQEAATETAPAIQRLIELGAVIVGKQKLAQFSSGAQPWEWEDEQYPFNSRGDGWQSCSASSSGGACSIAAYDWLDVAIGSDTGGSMRMPAALAGVYGNRPSQGAVSLAGMMPIGHATDTAGVFARDPALWSRFAQAWYSSDLHETSEINDLPQLSMLQRHQYPRTLLWPDDYFSVSHPEAKQLVTNFIREFSNTFNINVQHLNFTSAVLNASDPIAADFKGRLDDVFMLNSQHSFEEIYKPFLSTWLNKHGRVPLTDPDFRARIPHFLDRIENEDIDARQQAYGAAVQRKRRAVEWFNSDLFPSGPSTCSDNVMIYDIGSNGLPSYREKHLNVDSTISADTSYLRPLPPGVLTIPASICSVFACADYTLPIGQVEYFSQVTLREEMLPITINLVVKRGCDFMLFDMVERMAEVGILQTVRAGQTAF